MKWKSILIYLLLIIIPAALCSQKKAGRVLYNASMEVHFIPNKSVILYKDNGKITSSSLVDVLKRKLYILTHINEVPVSYKLIDLNEVLTEENLISREAYDLSVENKKMDFGLVENDSKVILGFQCDKYTTMNGYSYNTDQIPSQLSIWDGLRAYVGGIPLELYNKYTNEVITAISMDDKVDLKYLDINFDNLKNEDVQKVNEEEDEESLMVMPAPGFSINDKIDNSDSYISKLVPHRFKNTGISLNAPENYIIEMLCNCPSKENSWSMDAKEFKKGNKDFDFFQLDTINMRSRFSKIQAFFAPFFKSTEYVFSEFPTSVSFNYVSSKVVKINNHSTLIVYGSEKNYHVSYIVIFTDKTYALIKVLYGQHQGYLFKNDIEKYFSYDDAYKSKF